MRCDCCNRNLSDYESTLRHGVTNEFMNTCLKCLEGLEIPTRGRPDLSNTLIEDDTFDEALFDEDVEE